ncbi:hypothetical protein GCM10022421_30890 [Oceanisphaera sediminis]|uniref:DoxX family protein n=1 Tax=Oceanisphaera sediminis TaxID=981381 RepID=A0ABP7EQK9_9GAMM
MADIVPKITDIKNLQDLGKVFSLPMLAVAYILQTGVNISWDGSVWFGIPSELEEYAKFNRFVLIVILKTIWISGIGATFYAMLAGLHIYSRELLLPIAAIIMFVFGLLGLFSFEEAEQMKSVNNFWFYACFVWGFFLLSMKEQIDSAIS